MTTPILQVDADARYASVMNVSQPQDKLRKPKEHAPIRNEEMNRDLLKYVINLLSPPLGSVLDPRAGVMEITLACLQNKRRCLSLEREKECYRFAIGRVRIFATPEAHMENLSAYVDPIEERKNECGNDENIKNKH